MSNENLELRKQALEATGLTFGNTTDGSNLHTAMLKGSGTKQFHAILDDLLRCLPAVESDPGISEPWFLEWCAKNNYGWCLYFDRPGVINCTVVDLVHAINVNPLYVDVRGATPSEARARAVVMASKEKRDGME